VELFFFFLCNAEFLEVCFILKNCSGAAGAAALPARLDPDGAAGRRLHPAVEGRFEFWGDATSMSEGDFSVGSVGERRIDN
jgi:hypothetical protein